MKTKQVTPFIKLVIGKKIVLSKNGYRMVFRKQMLKIIMAQVVGMQNAWKKMFRPIKMEIKIPFKITKFVGME